MARRSDSAAPREKKKPGRFRERMGQMVEIFKLTQRVDKSLAPLMIGTILGTIVVMVLLSWLIIDSPWYGIFLGLAVGALLAMLIFARKAQRAQFNQIKGQPGAALAAMQSIQRGWNVSEEPVQMDPRSQKMIFRASGRAGIVLVAEDATGPSMRLLEKERKAIRRVLHEDSVPVHEIIVGDGEGQIPLHKLPTHMGRLKRTLTRDESTQVINRLAAIHRPIRQSIPKGIDPNRARPNRKAMRGR